MDNLASARRVRELRQKYGFSLTKSLGQNFLVNPAVCPRIAELGGADGDTGVLEIGAGFGALTAELCRRAKKVVAVEIDRSLAPVLAETVGDYPNLRLVFGDVLKLDLPRLLAEEFGGEPVRVCANLPYYVTSPILLSLLEQRLPLESITVLVQKEAAQRLCARMGTRECGAVTAAVRYYSEPRLLFSVARGSFFPPPNVDSAVIRLDVRAEAPAGVADEAFLFRVVRLAFGERRKTLANPVSAGLGLPKSEVRAALEAAGASLAARAEELSMEQFIRLANELGIRMKEAPR